MPTFFLQNSEAHFMTPGSIQFIPAWILLLITIITFVLLKPNYFDNNNYKSKLINPLFLAFIIGSLIPVFDDFFAFVLGPPFAHHSFFHSILGPPIILLLTSIIFNKVFAKYIALGHFAHILFNFYFDRITLFFPLTYREIGIGDVLGVSTYWIKIIHYPIILLLFFYSTIKFLKKYK